MGGARMTSAGTVALVRSGDDVLRYGWRRPL